MNEQKAVKTKPEESACYNCKDAIWQKAGDYGEEGKPECYCLLMHAICYKEGSQRPGDRGRFVKECKCNPED